MPCAWCGEAVTGLFIVKDVNVYYPVCSLKCGGCLESKLESYRVNEET
jgi:endogenous inhibitor of DNA gyrase (YacG/DUF329 family)